MRHIPRVGPFALAIVACVLAGHTAASARRAHNAKPEPAPQAARSVDICDVIAGQGSRVVRSSPVFLDGRTATATLAAFCNLTSGKIDPKLLVQGQDGKFYGLKLIFQQAEALGDVEQAAAAPRARSARVPPPASAPSLTWDNDLQQQFAYLQALVTDGKSPCPGGDESCLEFAQALDSAVGAPALGPSSFAFPIGDLNHGRNGNPYIGVVMSSTLTPHLALRAAPAAVAPIDVAAIPGTVTVSSTAANLTPSPLPTASPASPASSAAAVDADTLSNRVAVTSSSAGEATTAATGAMTGIEETSSITLYIGNTPYTIVTFAQNLGLQSPLTYAIDGRIGLGKSSGCAAGTTNRGGNFQDFCTSFSGTDLAFKQSTDLGGEFAFCPKPTLPIPGAAGIALLTIGCHGSATLAYDVNVAPHVGYARIVPTFDLHLRGSLKVNAVLVSGGVDADLTVAKVDGSAGFIYGTFADPFHGNAPTLAYRPFAYYNATALPLDLTLSVKTFWGYRRRVTFHLYAGFSLSSPPLDPHRWSVEKL